MHRNYYGSEPTTTDSVRVAEDRAEHVVDEIKRRIGSGAHELESIVENAERNVQGRAREMEERAQERTRYVMSMLQGQGDDEGDGCVSDYVSCEVAFSSYSCKPAYGNVRDACSRVLRDIGKGFGGLDPPNSTNGATKPCNHRKS